MLHIYLARPVSKEPLLSVTKCQVVLRRICTNEPFVHVGVSLKMSQKHLWAKLSKSSRLEMTLMCVMPLCVNYEPKSLQSKQPMTHIHCTAFYCQVFGKLLAALVPAYVLALASQHLASN